MKMHFFKKTLIAVFVILFGIAFGFNNVAAKDYPSKPIKIIVPFAAGGGTDILGRVLAKSLAEQLNATVIVENIAGASGTVGAARAALASADGYTIFLGATVTNALAPLLFKVRYDPVKDFEPLAQVSTFGNPLIVNPKLPINNIEELVKWSKSEKDGGSYGTWGVGSVPHLVMEFFNNHTGSELVHIPYSGAILVLNGVVAGDIPVGFSDAVAVIPFYKSEQVRVIAVTGSERSANMPEVPTLSEQGIPLSSDSWYGLFAPKGMPEDISSKLKNAIQAVLSSDDMKKSIEDLGMVPSKIDTTSFDKVRRDDLETWRKLVEMANISAE